jgi:hypothetical protein
VTFTFLPNQRTLRDAFDEKRTWLESIAEQATGRKLSVAAAQGGQAAAPEAGETKQVDESQKAAERKSALREQAMADASVQAMLEIFPAEIRDVEEM